MTLLPLTAILTNLTLGHGGHRFSHSKSVSKQVAAPQKRIEPCIRKMGRLQKCVKKCIEIRIAKLPKATPPLDFPCWTPLDPHDHTNGPPGTPSASKKRIKPVSPNRIKSVSDLYYLKANRYDFDTILIRIAPQTPARPCPPQTPPRPTPFVSKPYRPIVSRAYRFAFKVVQIRYAFDTIWRYGFDTN